MLFIRAFLFFVLVSQNSFAMSYVHKFSFNTKMTYIESATQQARSFGITPAGLLDIKISDKFKFFSKASILLETGSHKSALLDEFKPAQQVILNYAFFDINPWVFTHFDFGAIPMKKWAPDILISSTRFFGATIDQAIPLWAQAQLHLQALTSIPSNQELTNRLGGVSEGTPNYWQAGMQLDLPGDILGINARGFAWGYDNINGNVAYQSGFMGNQTLGIGSTNSTLAYKFNGYAGSLDFNGTVDQWNWGFGGDYIFNDGAPNQRNQATKLRMIIDHNDYQSTLTWFDIQSDATIGYYNNALLGHTNRNGFSYQLEIKIDSTSKIILNYVHSTIIKQTLVQSDQDALSFNWSYQLN